MDGEEKAVCILVADDLAEWRDRTRSILQARPEWQLLEASNGLEAIQRTIESKPNIVLMDIRMPLMNGIEAAKSVRQTVPAARIIFVTQERDADITAAALATGAIGYVLKENAGRELLSTIGAALNNARQSQASSTE